MKINMGRTTAAGEDSQDWGNTKATLSILGCKLQAVWNRSLGGGGSDRRVRVTFSPGRNASIVLNARSADVIAIAKALKKDGVIGVLKYADASISGTSIQIIFSRS